MEWKFGARNGTVVAGGNGIGNRSDQLWSPLAVIVDQKNDSLIICDLRNRRVVVWSRQNATSGDTIISNITCWSIIMDNKGYLYVSDFGEHEVRRWKMGDTVGTLVAGGGEEEDELNQLLMPHGLFIDENYSVYVSDWYNNRVMKWMMNATEGIVVAGGRGRGDQLKHLSGPEGLFVDQLGDVYVTDYGNHRIVRWIKGAKEGTIVVGGNGIGSEANQFNFPKGLAIDKEGSIYVVDSENHRVQKFDIDSD